jgi:hypothetical protein
MIKGVYPCPRRSIGTRIYIGPGQARDSLHFSFPDNPLSLFCHQDHSEKKDYPDMGSLISTAKL